MYVKIEKVRKMKNEETQSDKAMEYYLKKVVYCTPGNLYWKDLNSRYLGANQFTIELMGLKSPYEAIGKSDEEIFGVETTKDTRANDAKVVKSKQPLIVEEKMLMSDGTERIFITAKIPLKDKDGHITGVIGNSIEITAQKELELKLKKAKEEAERAKNALAFCLDQIISSSHGIFYWVRTESEIWKT